MKKTTNYGLTLYDKEDKMSITAEENSLNANMKIIDNTLKEKASINDMTDYIEKHKEELKGEKGDTGATGPQGPQGIQGKQGIQGEAGPQGEKGETGATGPQGIQGEKGPKGDTGSQGPSGKDGTNGIDGKDGYSPTAKVETTSTGATITITDKNGTTTTNITNGKDGAKGDKGDTGATGSQGPKGDTGEKGEQGAKGDTGPAGKDGANGKDGVSVTHSWDGTTLTVTSASGTSSANLKGDKGDTGSQGPKGDTGATGSKGADGYTPVKGTDYWTTADKEEMKEYVKGEIPTKTSQLTNDSGFLTEVEISQEQMDEIAEAVAEATRMDFVNSTDECTDPKKKYVLPDGYIYAYMHTGGYTNYVPTSTDLSGNIYNGVGYQDGYRLKYEDSGVSVAELAGHTNTGFIPYRHTQLIRMKGATWGKTNKNAIMFYDENKKPLGGYIGNGYVTYGSAANTTEGVNVQVLQDKESQSVTIDENGIVTFNMTFNTSSSSSGAARAGTFVRYVRIGCEGSGATMRVTIDEEPIGEPEGQYEWVNTGVYYGSNDNVTAESIETALGYKPANAQEIEDLMTYKEDYIITPDINGYVQVSDLYFKTNSEAKRTDYISVYGYHRIEFTTKISSSGYAVLFFDENKVAMTDVSVIGTNSKQVIDMAIPEGAMFVICCQYEYPSATGRLYRTSNNDTANVISQLKKTSYTFEGKKVMFFGDSITYDERMYHANLLERTGMVKIYSFAQNGARLQNYSDTVMDGIQISGDSHNNTVPNQVQHLLNNITTYTEVPDIIIVSAATNGGASEEGLDETQYTDSNDAYIDIDTVDLKKFSGAMRWIYEKLKELYPDVIICFATPIQSANGGARRFTSLRTKAECIRQNCERLCTPCIDAFRNSGINARYEVASASGKYLKDGLHPNSAGAVVLAKCYHKELANALID